MIDESKKQNVEQAKPVESGQNQKRSELESSHPDQASIDAIAPEPSILTAGERRVLLWCGNGKTSFEISRILGLSEHTVNHYIASAVRKLDATNRTHAIAKAIKMGIVDVSDIN